MNERNEIPLPDSEGLYRAWLESGVIHIEPRSNGRALRGIEWCAVLLFAFLPLGLYAILLAALYHTDHTLHWGVHLTVVGLGTVFCLVVLQQALGITGFRAAVLRRQDDSTVTLEYLSRGGRGKKCHQLAAPVCFVVQFHHQMGETSTSMDIEDVDGTTTRKHFRDVVGVDLHLQAASVTPPMALMEPGWCQVVPHRFNVYHSHYDPEANYTATVKATRPLADAIRECLGIPVEFRVEGGTTQERLEAGGGIVNSD